MKFRSYSQFTSSYIIDNPLQPRRSTNNPLPLLLSKGRILLLARGNPQERVTLSIRNLGSNKRRIDTLIAKRNLILLVVVDV